MIKSSTDNRRQVEKVSRAALPEPIVKYIEEVLRGPEPKSQLISVLHKVQGHFGYLGRAQMDAVAQLLQIPTAKVTGVASFYHFFRLRPSGKFIINACLGTACYVKGGSEIAARLKAELGVDFGETSKDGMFTLEAARCLGTCGLAPVVMVDNEVHGRMTPEQVPVLLAKYRAKAAEKKAAG
ncbi:MAG: NADH-quinone oxidoreductase subunit NuoE [Candidatus Brocadiia bacterium]